MTSYTDTGYIITIVDSVIPAAVRPGSIIKTNRGTYKVLKVNPKNLLCIDPYGAQWNVPRSKNLTVLDKSEWVEPEKPEIKELGLAVRFFGHPERGVCVVSKIKNGGTLVELVKLGGSPRYYNGIHPSQLVLVDEINKVEW
jgi:hypothetical protein